MDIDENWLEAAGLSNKQEKSGRTRFERIVEYLGEEGYDTVDMWRNVPRDQMESDLVDKRKLKTGEYRLIREAAASSGRPSQRMTTVSSSSSQRIVHHDEVDTKTREDGAAQAKPAQEGAAEGWFASTWSSLANALSRVTAGKESDSATVDARPLYGGKPIIGLVLLGETGAGKSTFYQSLVDHVKERTVDEVMRAEAGKTGRNTEQKEGDSQTKETTKDTIIGNEFVLHIIDTPGIGDTEGIQEDVKHIDNITDFLSRHEFNVVCILIKNGTNRKTSRMGYIISELKSNLTHNIWPRQVFTVITRCPMNRDPGSDTLAVVTEYGLPGQDLEGTQFFTVDNYAYEKTANPVVTRARRIAYDEAQGQLRDLIRSAGRLPEQSGEAIGELRRHRLECRDKAKEMDSTINNISQTESMLEREVEKLERATSEADLNKNFRREQPVVKKVPKDMPRNTKATMCGVCDARCHDPCYLENYGRIHGCSAFGTSDACKECRHGIGSHRHTNKYWVEETVMEPVLDTASERRYNEAKTTQEKIAACQQGIRTRLAKFQEERNVLTREIAEIYAEIDTLAVESFNEFFPKYVDEQIAALELRNLTHSQKRRLREQYEAQIRQYNSIREAVAMHSDSS